VREILIGVGRVRAALLSPAAASPYELTIGTRYELGLSWLCPNIPLLSRGRPERTIHLYNGDSPDLLLRLERGELDAIVASVRLTSTKLTYAAIHPETYVFVGRREVIHRREDARTATLVDVSADLPLFRYFLDALPKAEPWPFAAVEYMGGIGNIRRRVLDGAKHVAVLPEYFVREDLAKQRLVRLLPRARLASDVFRLVWRTGHPRTPELLALAGELRDLPLR
jgi:DNA-binding transcriptional LysR family regulator